VAGPVVERAEVAQPLQPLGGIVRATKSVTVALNSAAVRKVRPQIACPLSTLKNHSMTLLPHCWLRQCSSRWGSTPILREIASSDPPRSSWMTTSHLLTALDDLRAGLLAGGRRQLRGVLRRLRRSFRMDNPLSNFIDGILSPANSHNLLDWFSLDLSITKVYSEPSIINYSMWQAWCSFTKAKSF
jgi:hypothetical protein